MMASKQYPQSKGNHCSTSLFQ